MTPQAPPTTPRQIVATPYRWLLAVLGVFFVGLGAIGAVVPGVPTTIFLILASICFTRSCPWLEERLLNNRLFAPYMSFVRGETPMSPRAKAVALSMMWMFSSASAALLVWRGVWLGAVVCVALAMAGTFAIIYWRGLAAPRAK